MIVEKDGHLSAGCWDTGVWSTDHGKIPGSFRQSRGGVLEFDSVLAWLPIEKTEIDIKELWWNPEYRLISIIYDSIMVFAKDTDNYLTMPKSIIVISDMEIDYCGSDDWSFYENMKKQFSDYGYEIPNIVFWNVNSRHDVFHADYTRKGVQLCSGQSVTVFKQLLESIGSSPIEMMEKVINSERYRCLSVSEKVAYMDRK